ncbi:MAG TPA: DUF2721 domain-containing protein [Armatimonadota bacterium]|jgi:hypothetical protein
MPVQDLSRVIAASVVPVVIISACGLMCLAFYNRLSSIVGRLRAFQRERLQEQDWLTNHATEDDQTVVARHQQLLDMLQVQTTHVTRRARLIQRTLLCLLTAIGSLIVSSLCSGLSIEWPEAITVAAIMFVVGLLSVLAAVVFAMRELLAALEPIELESQFVADLVEGIEAGA